jgi:hypothetical protein
VSFVKFRAEQALPDLKQALPLRSQPGSDAVRARGASVRPRFFGASDRVTAGVDGVLIPVVWMPNGSTSKRNDSIHPSRPNFEAAA